MKEAKKKAIAEFPRRLRFEPPLRHIPRAASAPPSPSGSQALPPHCFPGVPGAHAQPPPPPGSRESRGGKPKSPGRLAFQQPLFLAGLGTGEGGWPVPGGFPWGLEASARLLVMGGGPGRRAPRIKNKSQAIKDLPGRGTASGPGLGTRCGCRLRPSVPTLGAPAGRAHRPRVQTVSRPTPRTRDPSGARAASCPPPPYLRGPGRGR